MNVDKMIKDMKNLLAAPFPIIGYRIFVCFNDGHEILFSIWRLWNDGEKDAYAKLHGGQKELNELEVYGEREDDTWR